jgi:Cu/Ag efflux pump CusA
MNQVRPKIIRLFPGVAMFFDPGGLVKRVTSFGSQKSVDVEIYGYDFEKARTVIGQVQEVMQKTEGLADYRGQPGRKLSRSQCRGGS